jgi:GDP-L-fucose synthase
MKRLFITGSSGFLGTHLKNELANYSKIELITPSHNECDLLSKQQIIHWLKETSPDVILTLSAKVGGIGFNAKYPADLLQENLEMATNLYSAAKETNCKTIYSLGSVCMYGSETKIPFKEDDLWNEYPHFSNAPYGISKKVLMLLGQTYKKQHGFKGAHLIPINMYGPFDCFDPERSHVIPALIKKFLEAKRDNLSEVECFGDGTCSREFLHGRAAAKCIVKAITSGLDTDLPINIGTGEEVIIKDLVELIKELTGYSGKYYFSGAVGNGQQRRSLCTKRCEELIGWKNDISLRDGLIETIEWYKQNYMKNNIAL